MGLRSNTGCAKEIVSERADGVSNQGQKDGSEDVVPACGCHFAMAEGDRSKQEFEGDPRDLEHRRRDAGLNLFDDDIAEAGALEFLREGLDLTECIDGPAFVELAVDCTLEAAKFSGSAEAVCNGDASAGPEKPVCFADETSQYYAFDARSCRVRTSFAWGSLKIGRFTSDISRRGGGL